MNQEIKILKISITALYPEITNFYNKKNNQAKKIKKVLIYIKYNVKIYQTISR